MSHDGSLKGFSKALKPWFISLLFRIYYFTHAHTVTQWLCVCFLCVYGGLSCSTYPIRTLISVSSFGSLCSHFLVAQCVLVSSGCLNKLRTPPLRNSYSTHGSLMAKKRVELENVCHFFKTADAGLAQWVCLVIFFFHLKGT